MRLIAPALVPLLLTACTGGGDECFDDRTCGNGNRCDIPAIGMPGTCTPCGASEIPYDGVDNDCNLSTRDRDLDGDGDNSFEGGGSDCDDNDPAVSSQKAEVCEDLKDNDCDGTVDELDCSDRESPTVVFISPLDNERLSGTFDVLAMVFDDVGLVSAQLFVDNTPVAASRDFTPPVMSQTITFTVDSVSEGLADGMSTLRIELEDVAGKAGQATRAVIIDNRTPPTISPLSPLPSRAYGGDMLISADVTDTTSVVVEFAFNGTPVDTATRAPYRTTVDTRLVPDGTATVSISASDLDGNTRTHDIIIRIDNTPPQVGFVAPQAGATVSLLLDVLVEAGDSSGIATLRSSGFTRTSTSLSYRINTEQLLNGPYTLTASASDGAIVGGGPGGNWGSASVTVTVDNSNAPQISLVPVDGDAVFGTTTIEATVVSPLDSAIDEVEIRVDGRSLTVTGNGPYRASYDFLFYPSPTAVIEVVAIDEDGRPGAAMSTVSITEPPIFRVTPQRSLVGFSGDGFDLADLDGDGVADVVAGGTDVQVLTGTIGADGDWSPGPPAILDATNGADLVQLIDTDGDLDRDLITVMGNRIRLYLNDGGLPTVPDATQQIAQYTGFSYMEAADLDADLDADLILSGPNGVDVVVVRNENNASFSFDGSYGLVGAVSDLALADADDDGDLDAVIGRSGSSNVITTYRNLGGGVFGAGQDSFTTGSARYVAVGDVTGDGYPDVVAVVQTGSLLVLTGNSATPGTFTQSGAHPIPPTSREVRIADINLDGNLDVLLNAFQANGLDQLLNLGGAVFVAPADRPRFVIARRPIRPRLWDVDGDGDLDYLAIGSIDNTLAFSENLGLGNLFAAPVVTPSEVPRSIAAGDVYGVDGQDDFVLGFSETGTTPARISIWQNSLGDITPRGQVSVGTGVNRPTSIAIGDLDGVGLLDIAVGSNELAGDMMTGDAPAVAMINNGNLAFTRHNIVVPRPLDALIADADNDGIEEVIFTFDLGNMPVEGSEVWDVSGGAPVRLRMWPEGLGARALAAGDLGADPSGFIDYAVANAGSNDITISLWNGSGWSSTSYTALPGILDVAIGYVGNDAYADLIAVGTPGLIVMAGQAGNAFTQPVTYPAGPTPSKLVAGDLNDDGINDVLVLNSANQVSALIGKPNGGFFPPLSIPVGDTPVDFATTDFDGDGRGDLAIACTGVPAVVMVYSDAP